MIIPNLDYKIISFGLVMLLLVGSTACNDLEELNTPDDKLTADDMGQKKLGQVFARSQYYGMFVSPGSFQIMQNLYSDLYSQYYATSVQYFDTDHFEYVPGWVQSGWDSFYTDAAPQLEFVENFTSENNMSLENAVAKVWRVAIYHRMTDYFGPIIYSEFGNGEISVAYDSQESIYMDFFKTLDEGISVLEQNTDGSVFPSNDLVYSHSGNVNQWLKFANSLRLRLAMRIGYVEPSRAKQEAEKAMNAVGGVIMDNSDNATVMTTTQSINPHTQTAQWREYRMSAAMVSALKGFEDPRQSEYMNEADIGGGYSGLRNGLPQVQRGGGDMDEYSFVDTKLLPVQLGGTNPPWHIMYASEVYFLRAEGALRGWNMGGTAEQLYNKGISASLENRTSASLPEINKYINSTSTPAALNDKWNSPPVFNVPVKYQSEADFETKLEQIISQKWLALYPDGWEAWTERRRTGYPNLYPLIDSGIPEIPEDAIIRRMKFVQDEYLDNTEAVEQAINLLHNGQSDNRMVRLWWDAKDQ